MISLCKALNRYTSHKARCITFKQTYLNYETDVFDPTINEVEELADWADFFVLGELLPYNGHTKPIYRRIRPENTVLRAGGSLARMRPDLYMRPPFDKIIKTGAYHDWSLYMVIYPMANTVNMYHFDEFPKENKDSTPPYRLLFSGTKYKRKRADIIQEAWRRLHKRLDNIEFVQVVGKSWKESLEEKAKGHIQYDHSMLLGAYASNAIEAMYYHMPVFCSASGWCRTTYPDLPVIHTRSADEMVSKTIELINNPDLMEELGDRGHEFAIRYHDARNAVRRWEALIEYVTEEYKYHLTYSREDIVHANVDIEKRLQQA